MKGAAAEAGEGAGEVGVEGKEEGVMVEERGLEGEGAVVEGAIVEERVKEPGAPMLWVMERMLRGDISIAQNCEDPCDCMCLLPFEFL